MKIWKCAYLILLITASVHAQITNTFKPNNAFNSNSMNINKLQKQIMVKLVIPGSSGQLVKKCQINNVSAREIIYRPTEGSEMYSLAAIYDSHSKKTFIVPSLFDFYISNGSGMLACKLSLGDLVWCKNYFEVIKSTGDLDAAIAQFASSSDENVLRQKLNKIYRVSLRNAAPPLFFTTNSGTSQPTTGTIKTISMTDDTLRLDMISEGGKFTGSFWIDLKAGKIIKSVIDGQEMDLNTGRSFAVPLKKK
jgi:hypothetical protein